MSDWLLSGVLLGPAETVGRLALVLGVVLLVLFTIVVRFLQAEELYGNEPSPPEQQTNCQSCGARNPVDAATCHHCGDPLDTAE